MTEPEKPLLTERLDQWLESKRQVYPQHVNRASQMGHPCDRFLMLSRTHWQHKQLPSRELQARFEVGHQFEAAMKHRLAEAGVQVDEAQRAFELKGRDGQVAVTGHIDGMVSVNGERMPIEIKSCSQFIFPNIESWDSLFSARHHWLRGYPAQMSLYMLGTNRERGIMLFASLDGRIKEIEARLDYHYAEALLQRAERINEAVAFAQHEVHRGKATSMVGPDPIPWDDRVCGDCPLLHVCEPERDFGDTIAVETDPEMIAMLDRRGELVNAYREYQDVDKLVKGRLKNISRALCGDWQIRGHHVEPTGRKPYWKTDIRSLSK